MNKAPILIGTMLATGCSTFQEITTPFEFNAVAPDAPAEWAAAGVSGTAEQGDWLSGFNDAVLGDLVSEALSANPSLEAQM
ncbi:MAG: RND transporter, partial [Pseudomonadota bacterium]